MHTNFNAVASAVIVVAQYCLRSVTELFFALCSEIARVTSTRATEKNNDRTQQAEKMMHVALAQTR